MITKKSKTRLTRLANFLKKLPAKQFDYANIVSNCDGTSCGTVACAAGWLPKISSLFTWKKIYDDNYDLMFKSYKNGKPEWIEWATDPKGNHKGWGNISHYFGISVDDARGIFEPFDANLAPWNPGVLNRGSTAKQVAKHIEKFIAWKTNN